ncbi:NUDIX hydrolase [Bacillus suaedaesalsae]|uniref:NUDIX domain-containing protein n=1 Tax=Bacillus suaedaesalsae TaxID=2810349 RepID=A0ABS2DME0_9BACI|nr:NUDIX domain-containing protein [Bacillus suaedaesalsae]MBM6618671.1 NUDIX domain-containing protein [Bacillus suaedaesalsae]
MINTTLANWDGNIVKLTWKPSKVLPDEKLITSVHGYCFNEGNILLVKIKDRGFNTPGGHIEKGESAEDTFHREALEEGYVNGKVTLLGYIEVNHEDNPLYEPDGKYPLVGYQVYYRMDIHEILPFQGDYEATARIWVEPDLFTNVIDDHILHRLILEEALKASNH